MAAITYNHESKRIDSNANVENAVGCGDAEMNIPQHLFPRIQWIEYDSNEEEEFHSSIQNDRNFSKLGLPRWNAQLSGLYRMDSFSSSFNSNLNSNRKDKKNSRSVPILYGQASAALGIQPSSIYEEECYLNNKLLDSHRKSWRHFVIPDLDQLITNYDLNSSNIAY